MKELFNIALHPLNIPFSLLLAVVLLYWITVILGALEMDAFDLDIDGDTDTDAASHAGGGSWFAAALHFFHFDRLPFMLIMSLVVLASWALSILSNHYWGHYHYGFAVLMAGPIVLVSFIIAKLVSFRLLPLFAATNTAVAAVEYMGKVCKVKLPPSDTHFGQAGLWHAGDELLVHIKVANKDIQLQPGQEVIIIGHTDDERYWLVEPLE
ncbi:MAG: DUF1449 family protein [Saprospiraceae bacterium]